MVVSFSSNLSTLNLNSSSENVGTRTGVPPTNLTHAGYARTVGLHDYGGLDHSDFFATVGMNIYDLWKDAFCNVNGQKATLEEALKAKQYKKVYFQIGINEMGRGTLDGFMNEYQNAVEKFKTLQPDAIIYVEANLHVTAQRSDSDKTFNNANINAFNQKISTLADQRTIYYLDINELFDDANGNLGTQYSNDNAHPLGKYYAVWCDWLMEHAVVRDGKS